MSPSAEYARVMAKAPLKPVRGVFYRAVPEPAAEYALEDGTSYTYQNRYNAVQQFGALYFGDRAEVCKSTLEKRGLLASRRLPHLLLSFDIDVDHVLDLTHPEAWKLLGLERDELVAPRGTPTAYETTTAIATSAYHSNRIRGLLVPDATETGNTLVLYPARLLARDFIRVKDKTSI
jgi:RES domain-containing protein